MLDLCLNFGASNLNGTQQIRNEDLHDFSHRKMNIYGWTPNIGFFIMRKEQSPS